MLEPISFKKKEYISAKDAAALTGYTSDYVGQLARSGKLESKLVGRARFVDRDGILKYKRKTNGKDKRHDSVVKKEIRKETTPKNTSVEKKNILKEDRSYKPLPVFHEDMPLRPTLSHPTKEKVEKETYKHVLSVNKHKQSSDTKKFLTPQLLLLFSIVLIALGILTMTTSVRTSLEGKQNVSETIVANAVTAKVGSFFKETAEWIQNLFVVSETDEYTETIVTIPGESADVFVEETDAEQQESIVVIPSGDEELVSEDVVTAIKNSFSDEVDVVASEYGVHGTIIPVFKETLGEKYLYVLVPATSEDDSSQP